jgi:hypothetical protein
VTTYPDVKVMEDACRVDYKKIYGKYPPWNFQENGEKWPEHIQKLYTEQMNQQKKKDGITSNVVNLIDTTDVIDTFEPAESYVETWV